MNLHSIKLLFGPEAGHLQPFFLRTEGRLQKKNRQIQTRPNETKMYPSIVQPHWINSFYLRSQTHTIRGNVVENFSMGLSRPGHGRNPRNRASVWKFECFVAGSLENVSFLSQLSSGRSYCSPSPHHCASSCPHHVPFLLLNWSPCLQAQTPTLPGNLE